MATLYLGFFFFSAVRGPLTVVASPVAEHRLWTRRLSGHGSRAQPPRGMWDLPGPGLKPVSPAFAGGFLTTAPPGKSDFNLSSARTVTTTPWGPGCVRFVTKHLHRSHRAGGDGRRDACKVQGFLLCPESTVTPARCSPALGCVLDSQQSFSPTGALCYSHLGSQMVLTPRHSPGPLRTVFPG